MRTVLAAAALLLAAPAMAQGFDIQIDNFTAQRGIAEVVMRVTNNTGADARSVFIDCAFMDKDKRAIDIGKALIPAIRAGDYAFDKAMIPRADGVQYVECGVSRYDPA